MSVSVHSRALQRAAEILGGRDRLAQYLGVPLAELMRWISGAGKPPQHHFLRAVELIIDETLPPENGDAPDPPASNDCAGAGRFA